MHIRDAVKNLQPYRPGRPLRDLERLGVTGGVKLGSNENPLGPAPEVVSAIGAAAADCGLYPEPGSPRLRESLAGHLGRGPEEIICGAGIDDLLDLTARSVLEPGDNLVLAQPGFVRYAVAARCAGGDARAIVGRREHPYRHDLEAMLAAIDERTRIIVVVNPNNPTGSMVPCGDWESFSRVPRRVHVILDEAYFEFVDDPDYPNGLDYLDRFENLLVFRTFSKCHALAGLRIGYGIGSPELIGFLDRARLPFNVSTVAEAAALTALAHPEHVTRSRELARNEVALLSDQLQQRGWKTEPSWANFVFAEAPVPGAELSNALLARGFILRPLTSFGLSEQFFRISHGTREQNLRFLATLDAVSEEQVTG